MSTKLSDKLVAIGFRLSSSRKRSRSILQVDIENTLLEAIMALPDDLRLASLLFTWIKIHGNYVIVEKLRKRAHALGIETDPWYRALAAFAVENKYHKWKPLLAHRAETVYLLPPELSLFPIQRKGAVEWLEPYGILLPEGTLRIREDDILTPKELIQRNAQYRNRYLYGPSWRADIITAIEQGCTSPMEISRLIGCSYEPAYRVFNEYQMATGEKTA